MKSEILQPSFYLREDVVLIARELLGKVLCTSFNNEKKCGIITETEAYAGITDRASHAFGGRNTKRTEVMFMQGGVAYVYLCYGIHSLFNVVTNIEGVPHAVLIRAVEIEGISRLKTKGPGKLSTIMGIHYSHSGLSLAGSLLWIEDCGIIPESGQIQVSARIGVDYAGPDKDLPYRFEYRR